MLRVFTLLLAAYFITGPARSEGLPVPTPATSEQDAERQQFWESDAMVEARLYMEDYYATSVQVTEAEAQEFWNRMDSMTTSELKAWLARFNHERRQRARLHESSNRIREYKLAEAKATRSRDAQINAQFNRLVREGASLSQSRVEKGFARTAKTKRYPWYPRRQRLFFWLRF